MARVDFYILQGQQAQALFPFACRLMAKAFKKGHQIYVQLTNDKDCRYLDDLLWSYDDISFIPHAINHSNDISSAPILLGFGDIPKSADDILINLTDIIPTELTQFKRIIEIVPEQEPWKQNSRKKYAAYAAKNCELQMHPIASS